MGIYRGGMIDKIENIKTEHYLPATATVPFTGKKKHTSGNPRNICIRKTVVP
jgi:hypothetical protein